MLPRASRHLNDDSLSQVDPPPCQRIITWNHGVLALLHPFKVAPTHTERLVFQRFESIPYLL